jgi:dihydroorotate dehydrogenase
VINRLGFPNEGAEVVAARLKKRRYRGVLGVNVGKNADTPLDRAVDDYVACMRTVYAVCDYVAANISSPNTAQLRELHEPARLEPFLSALVGENAALARRHGRRAPLLLKISPDLDDDSLASVATLAKRCGVDGLIATNTTVKRDPALPPVAKETGGLSGAPLHAASLRVVATLRGLVGPTYPLVGVGGIDSPEKAAAMRRAGADLVQIYTGMIFAGPTLAARCVRSIG